MTVRKDKMFAELAEENARLKAEVERLTKLSESALKGESEYAAAFGRWADKYKIALKALVQIREGTTGAVHDIAKVAIEKSMAIEETRL